MRGSVIIRDADKNGNRVSDFGFHRDMVELIFWVYLSMWDRECHFFYNAELSSKKFSALPTEGYFLNTLKAVGWAVAFIREHQEITK